MQIKDRLVEGWFVARDNRFRVTVDVGGQEVWAHLPNSGRLAELLAPGRTVLLTERHGRQRKTGYDLSLVEMDRRWVSLDARLPNTLVEEALTEGRLTPLAGYPTIRREVPFGRSRLDFMLEAPDKPPCLLEVKSVTLVVGGLGCFPDAVTIRGRRHLQELAVATESGYRAAVIFVVQRDDAIGLRPHDESDPDFGQTLRDAAQRGVEIYAYGCRVEPGCVEIDHALRVHLGEQPAAV
jgi:sugar fermentation stimulation protein A